MSRPFLLIEKIISVQLIFRLRKKIFLKIIYSYYLRNGYLFLFPQSECPGFLLFYSRQVHWGEGRTFLVNSFSLTKPFPVLFFSLLSMSLWHVPQFFGLRMGETFTPTWNGLWGAHFLSTWALCASMALVRAVFTALHTLCMCPSTHRAGKERRVLRNRYEIQPADHPEGGEPGAAMYHIVICHLCKWQELLPN